MNKGNNVMSELMLQRKQLEFFNSNAKFNIFRSYTRLSRGKGGTTAISELMYHKIKYGYGNLEFLLFPYAVLPNSYAYKQYLDSLNQLSLERKKVNNTYYYSNEAKNVSLNIVTNNFSFINHVRGYRYDVIFIDDVLFNLQDLNDITARLKKNGKIYVNYTPPDDIEKDVYLEFFFKNKKDSFIVSGSMNDNKYIPDEFKEVVFEQYKHLI